MLIKVWDLQWQSIIKKRGFLSVAMHIFLLYMKKTQCDGCGTWLMNRLKIETDNYTAYSSPPPEKKDQNRERKKMLNCVQKISRDALQTFSIFCPPALLIVPMCTECLQCIYFFKKSIFSSIVTVQLGIFLLYWVQDWANKPFFNSSLWFCKTMTGSGVAAVVCVYIGIKNFFIFRNFQILLFTFQI